MVLKRIIDADYCFSQLFLKKIMYNIIMHCSTLDTKGGMVSVTKNYLNYPNWGEYKIKFIPTHFDANKYVVIAFFAIRYFQILVSIIFGRYNVAHLHTAERGSFWRKNILLKTYHKFGVKVVMHHHAAEFDEFYASSSQKQKIKIRQALAEADVNIVLSERLVSMIKDKEPKAKVEVLYNAVQTFPSNPYNADAKGILFLGRLGKRKGTFDLLDAIKRLDNKIPREVVFYLCGDGEIEHVKERVSALNIEHRIAHIGWIDGAQKESILQNTMINVLPSYNEGLPMTILETMAHGIPNISTRIASIPEVIKDGENGFMIMPGDVESLTTCIERLVTDVELRGKFSRVSYDLVTNDFSLNTNIEKLKQIYKSLLNTTNSK